MLHELPRIVCIVGPTASGKTALGVRLAKKFHGEIINADARQIYKYFDIGTGKPAGKLGVAYGHRTFLVQGVPHYLMDFLDPRDSFTVVEWRERAVRAIKGILERGHLPIVVGGTGLYMSALVENFSFPAVAPNAVMRKAFELKPLAELAALLLRIDPSAAHTIDLKNPRRVIRALEVVTFTGRPFNAQIHSGERQFNAFQIGIHWTREELNRRIDAEINQMLQRGWLEEICGALKKGILESAQSMTSIGYRELLRHIRREVSLDAAIVTTKHAVHRYAKRQQTWFKRDKRIRWAKNELEAVKLVQQWLAHV